MMGEMSSQAAYSRGISTHWTNTWGISDPKTFDCHSSQGAVVGKYLSSPVTQLEVVSKVDDELLLSLVVIIERLAVPRLALEVVA